MIDQVLNAKTKPTSVPLLRTDGMVSYPQNHNSINISHFHSNYRKKEVKIQSFSFKMKYD